ncbi:MAG: hypothetical protein J6W26_08270 [Bacteroidales bacterium]|nr:hypothetical protein [Bacteroidales bacterium]
MPGFILNIGKEKLSLPNEVRHALVIDRMEGEDFQLERRVVNKFMNDRLFSETTGYLVVVEGIVLNNHELMAKYQTDTWLDCVVKMYEQEGEAFFNAFRGSFSGALYDKKADKWIVYTCHTGEKQVFYTSLENGFLMASEMRFMVETMKANQIHPAIDEVGCYFSLTHGFCIEDRTLVKEVHKLIAGHYLRIQHGKLEVVQYHRFSNKPVAMSVAEAVEGIDRLFRQAVRRAFEKDKEYGYRHLTCLSGGLDSRMTVWVAHELGYTDQTNIDYSQSGYLDFTISQQIAIDLHHDYFFSPLDHGDFIHRYQFLPALTYGSGFMLGHGYSLEQLIDYDSFGLFHTGQLGDVIIGSYLQNLDYGIPTIKDGAYSLEIIERLEDYKFTFEYENSELFRIYNRGLNGINQGLLTYQENTESYSPFTDVDFFEFCYSIPLNLRFRHKIYFDWILDKYPQAGEYVWENTRQKIHRIENHPQKTMKVLGYEVPHILSPDFGKYVKGFVLRRLGLRKKGEKPKTIVEKSSYNMNPVDYWYDTNPAIKRFMDAFWEENHTLVPDPQLHDDMEHLFKDCVPYDKMQCLSVLAAIKLIEG